MGDILTHTTKTGRIRYYARYVEIDGRRTSRATPAKTPEEAQKWLEKAETRVAGGLEGVVRPKAPDKPRMTVRQICEKFCGVNDEFQSGAGGENTDPIHYRRQVWSVLKCHVLPRIGSLDGSKVRRVDIVTMRDAMAEDKTTNTRISRALRDLSRVFNWAIEMEHIEGDNPARRVKKPRCEGSTKLYSEAEVGRLLAWSAEHDPTLHVLIAFAFYTGCRKGEIAALEWSDIDWKGSRIVVQRSWKRSARKSGKAVVVSLHPHLAAILGAHQKRTGGKGEALVFTDKKGHMLPKFNGGEPGRNLWGLDVAIKKKKVRRFLQPWHAFRHTHATQLAMGGAGLTAIRDALGQATLHMAANYTHLAASHVAEHVAKLPQLGPVESRKVTSIHRRQQASGRRTAVSVESGLDRRVTVEAANRTSALKRET